VRDGGSVESVDSDAPEVGPQLPQDVHRDSGGAGARLVSKLKKLDLKMILIWGLVK